MLRGSYMVQSYHSLYTMNSLRYVGIEATAAVVRTMKTSPSNGMCQAAVGAAMHTGTVYFLTLRQQHVHTSFRSHLDFMIYIFLD